MNRKTLIPLFIRFVITISVIILASYFLSEAWDDKDEAVELPEIVYKSSMTLKELAEANELKPFILRDKLKISSDEENLKLSSTTLSEQQIKNAIQSSLALKAEAQTKNWIKILIKFALWIALLIVVFILLKKKKVTYKLRMYLFLFSAIIFGVILGAEPAPMGTVKDAIVLFGQYKVVFPPRMIALTVFILMVIIANKFICSWGCQLGTLQDFIFRLNRKNKDKKGIMKQYKPPFILTNTIRFLVFLLLITAAFLWAVDIFFGINPFKIFHPQLVTIYTLAGIIIVVLVPSLFVYRPFCHCICPFGFLGWLFEKISIYKIKVNYDSCISCEACSKACPSNVMDAILKQNKTTIPDCFACGTCIETCPTDSVSLSFGKRNKPPDDKFSQK